MSKSAKTNREFSQQSKMPLLNFTLCVYVCVMPSLSQRVFCSDFTSQTCFLGSAGRETWTAWAAWKSIFLRLTCAMIPYLTCPPLLLILLFFSFQQIQSFYTSTWAWTHALSEECSKTSPVPDVKRSSVNPVRRVQFDSFKLRNVK